MAQQPDIPKRWPMVVEPANRDDSTSKDARLVNAYVEKQKDGTYQVFKRPGLLEYDDIGGNGYGVFNWLGNIYSVFGGNLYKDGVSVGAVNSAGGVYRFDQTLGGTPRMVLGNGIAAYTYDGTTLTEIVDVDFPDPFVKGWAYLDGTLYVGRPDAGIQGSEINTPADWDPLNVIIAQIEPDKGIALSKQLVYVIMLKQWSVEAFYDAANATGSPLGRVEGAKISWGCASADSVRQLDGDIFWASTTRFSAYQVAMMSDVKAKIISTEPVERLLLHADTSGGVYSWGTRIGGHRFYGLTLVANNLTLVYDATENMWAQWTDEDGNYFPIVDMTYDSSGNRIVQHATNGKLYKLDPSYYNDAGEYIQVDIYTPNFDGGVRLNKHLERMTFIGDQVRGSTLQVRCNDWDYDPRRWTNFRNVDLGVRFPMLQNCGTFKRRAYHLRHRANTAFRMQAIDLSLSLGSI
jgi:hypothetical protein